VNCPPAPTDPVWIRLTVATVPAVIAVASAFIGVSLSNRNNLKLNHQKFAEDRTAAQRKAEEERVESGRRSIVERGDELYELLEAWSDEVAQASAMVWDIELTGQDAPVKYLEKMRESTRVLRLKFLTQVYFPDLSPLMTDVGTLWLDLGRQTIGKDRDLESDEKVRATRKRFRVAVIKLEEAVINAVQKNV
jgi:hypothetical protein